MEIIEVNASYFLKIISTPYHIFGSVLFNELNIDKCDAVHYLLFKEGKYRLGFIGGSKENSFYSPFSAPFGGFTFLLEDIRLQYIEEALELLKSWATEKKFTSINITLPPTIYNESFIAKQTNCLFRKGYDIVNIDLNYSFNLDDFDEKYIDLLWYNARKNLRIAHNSDLHFIKCKMDEEKKLAYDIIQKNRNAKGYPLRMSWQQVEKTTHIICTDFFLLYEEQFNPIAAAIVFWVSTDIVQVIYWGDLPEFTHFKTMNFLSYKVFEHYKKTQAKIIDIGPSTENSIPNFGLCEFKESIGCQINSKLTFRKILN